MFVMLIGSGWKKLQKIKDLSEKKIPETIAGSTFTLANAIFPA